MCMFALVGGGGGFKCIYSYSKWMYILYFIEEIYFLDWTLCRAVHFPLLICKPSITTKDQRKPLNPPHQPTTIYRRTARSEHASNPSRPPLP